MHRNVFTSVVLIENMNMLLNLFTSFAKFYKICKWCKTVTLEELLYKLMGKTTLKITVANTTIYSLLPTTFILNVFPYLLPI